MYSRLIKGFVPITATCKGDYSDPLLKLRIIKFKRTLQCLLKTGGRCIFVDDVSPWNSIRIKLRLSHDASLRLRELAQQRDQLLADLGILSLQFDSENETFTIVDVPSSSGVSTSQAGTSAGGNSSSYAVGPHGAANDPLFSFLVGGGHESAESKPVTGVRRTLPHSTQGLPDADYSSSSPKIPKRASGIRRPRGSRGARGARGGASLGASLGSVGSLETTSVSPTSCGSLVTGNGTGCETTGRPIASSVNTTVESTGLPSMSESEATFLPQPSISNLSDASLVLPAKQEHEFLPPPQISITPESVTCSEEASAVISTSSTRLESDDIQLLHTPDPTKTVDVAVVSDVQHSPSASLKHNATPELTTDMTSVGNHHHNGNTESSTPSVTSQATQENVSNRTESEECSRPDEIPSCQIPLNPLLAAFTRSTNGCSEPVALSTNDSATVASADSHSIGNNVTEIASVDTNDTRSAWLASSVTDKKELDSSKQEDVSEITPHVNGNSDARSEVTSMEVDAVGEEAAAMVVKVENKLANEENNELIVKGRYDRSLSPTASVVTVVESNMNGNHDDQPAPAAISAEES